MERKIVISLLIVSVLVLAASFLFHNSVEIGLCLSSQPTCLNLLTDLESQFFYAGVSLTLVFFLLLYIPKAYAAWFRFAVWYVPLAAVLFYFAPQGSNGGYINTLPAPSTIYAVVSAIYVVVSLGIIAMVARRGKGE